MNTQKTVCFVAGRSGGHILPALTLAQQYKELYPNATILMFTTDAALDKALVHENPIATRHITLNLDNVPRRWWRLPAYGFYAARSLVESLYHLWKEKPAKVISTGGYISIPVCIAARILRIPCELYTLDAVPGKATLFLAPYANTIYTCFSQANNHLPEDKCRPASYPLRFKQSTITNTQELYSKLNFDPKRKTLLVFGGSQGSVSLNNFIRQWLLHTQQVHGSIQIIHQTGSYDTHDWGAFYQELSIPAHVFEYDNAMDSYYSIADLVIARAGAGTLFELAFFKKQSIIIPLETATTDHQVENAHAMADMHPTLFRVLTQKEINTHADAAYKVVNSTLLSQ